MYTQEDLNNIREEKHKRWMKLIIPGIFLLGGVIASFIVRIEWITTLLSCILGCMILFTYEMHIKPLRCYETHLNNCLNGRTHELDGTYQSAEEEISLVDGVRYRGMLIHDDNPENDFDRLFYFDVEKPFPELEPGDKVHVVYHDREVVELIRI